MHQARQSPRLRAEGVRDEVLLLVDVRLEHKRTDQSNGAAELSGPGRTGMDRKEGELKWWAATLLSAASVSSERVSAGGHSSLKSGHAGERGGSERQGTAAHTPLQKALSTGQSMASSRSGQCTYRHESTVSASENPACQLASHACSPSITSTVSAADRSVGARPAAKSSSRVRNPFTSMPAS